MLEKTGATNPEVLEQQSSFKLKRLMKVAVVSTIAAFLFLLIMYLLGLLGNSNVADTISNVIRNVSSTGGNLNRLVNESFNSGYFAQLPTRSAPVAPVFTNASITQSSTSQSEGSEQTLVQQVENIVNNYISDDETQTVLEGPAGPAGPAGATGLQGERGPRGGGGGGSSYASPLTTEGDLLYHNGTGDARLARGTDGECLTSNTTTLVWGACGGGGAALSGLTAAEALNTIDNLNYAQTWNWDTLATETAMTLGSTSVSSGSLLNLNVNSTAAASNTQKALNVATAGANASATQTTYAGYFSNIHTGTTSTNVAGYFTASGGTNNYAGIFDAGNVGIGTTTPTSKLTVSSVSTVDGTELITNGTFTGSATGWTLGTCVVYGSNQITSTYNGSCTPTASTTYNSVAGTTYRVTFTVTSTRAAVYVYFADGGVDFHQDGPYATGTHTLVYTAFATGVETITFDSYYYDANTSWILDTVSVRAISSITPVAAATGFDGYNWLNLGGANLNTAAGQGSLQNVNGSALANTAFGANALQSATSAGNNTAIGANALSRVTNGGFANTAIGFSALSSTTSGDNNVAVGAENMVFNSTGSNNVALGYWTLRSNTTGSSNIGIGRSALLYNNTGTTNIGIGEGTLYYNTTGAGNTAIGNSAMGGGTASGNIGFSNVAVGSSALYSITTGNHNVGIGYQTLFGNQTGTYNTVMGSNAGRGYAGNVNHNFTGNTFIGANSGTVVDTDGNYNAAFGHSAGVALTTGDNNLFLGAYAGENVTTGTKNIVIGYDTWAQSASTSNQLNIGNLIYGTTLDGVNGTVSTGSIGIGTTAPDMKLEINSAAGNNLRLTYNDSNGAATTYTDFLVSSGGDLTVSPTGLDSTFTGNLATANRDWGVGAAGSVITVGRNSNGTTTGAGSVNFQSKAGTAGYVWQDNAGNVRVHTAAPSDANDTAGVVIGDQTSTRSTKQDITDYVDYAAALNMVIEAPLHTFKYKKDVQGYGANSPLAKARIGYIADEVSAQFMWGNSIDQVSVNGILMASVKELNNKVTTVQEQVGNFQGSGQLNVDANTPIVIKAHLYLSADSVGQAKILAGDKKVRVSFNKPYQYLPIVTATIRASVSGSYWIDEESSTGFTIHLSVAQSSDVSFNWHAFAGADAKLTVSDGSVMGVVTVQSENPAPQPEIVSPEPVAEEDVVVVPEEVIIPETETPVEPEVTESTTEQDPTIEEPSESEPTE